MNVSCVYLWILRSFSDHFIYRVPLGNCLFHLQVAEFQPPHTVKKYFTCTFQAFYTRRKSSYSKAFMYLKSLNQFVIFKPLNHCFKETVEFDVKASFESRPLSRLIRWYNTRWYEKRILIKGYSVSRDFSRIESYKLKYVKKLIYNEVGRCQPAS